MKTKYLLIILLLLGAILVVTSKTYSQVVSTVTKHTTLQGNQGEENIPFGGTTDHIYHINGNLTIDCASPPCNVSGPNSGVVFVEQALNINKNYTYGIATTGTVFVVKGNVNIDPSVTRIDAVIIAEGKIYTAGASCSQATPVSASQLVINGSFISLSEGSKIEFCRTLSDNSQPAEKINHQVKYLVILRNLLSDTIQKWSEIEAASIPTPTPTPTQTPTPTPSVAACRDGTNDQVYSSSMVGCNGSVTFDNASSLCASSSHVCSITEYLARGGQTTQPTGFRWLSTKAAADPLSCTSTLCGSTQCLVDPPGNSLGLMSAGVLRGYASSCSELDSSKVGWFSEDALTSNRGAVCCN